MSRFPLLSGSSRLTQVACRSRNVGKEETQMSTPTLGYTSGFGVDTLFACEGLQLTYCNQRFDVTNNGMVPGRNPIRVKASVLIGTTRHPVYIGGERTATIAPGDVVRTNPLNVTIPKGTRIKPLTYIEVDDGGYIPECGNGFGVGGTNPDTYDLGADTTDEGDISAVVGWKQMYIPLAIEAIPLKQSVIGVLGDSIGVILFDDQYEVPGIISAYPVVCQTTGGDRPYWYTSQTDRYRALDNCTHLICELGTNNFAHTAQQTIDELQAIWDEWGARGLQIWQTTIPPITTSTDGWTTEENQTPDVNKAWRDTINAYIRSLPSPLTGVIDLSDLWSTARDSGIWRIDSGIWTEDGIHPINTADGLARLEVKAAVDAINWSV